MKSAIEMEKKGVCFRMKSMKETRLQRLTMLKMYYFVAI